jgi:hypothetical protein
VTTSVIVAVGSMETGVSVTKGVMVGLTAVAVGSSVGVTVQVGTSWIRGVGVGVKVGTAWICVGGGKGFRLLLGLMKNSRKTAATHKTIIKIATVKIFQTKDEVLGAGVSLASA